MNENKNLILAVVLSALVLLGWSYFSDKYAPANPPPKAESKANPAQQPQPTPAPTPAAQTKTKLHSRAQVLASAPRVQIRTPSVQGSIDLKGARIDDLVLLRERQTIAKDSPPVRLLSPEGAPEAYYAGFGWTGRGVQVPGPDTIWTASAPVLQPGKPVELTWNNGQGQTFRLIVSVDDNYLFTVRQQVTNGGAAPVSLRPYGLISRAEKSSDPTRWTMHVGPIGVFNGAANYDVDYSNLDGEKPGFFGQLFGSSAKAGTNAFTSDEGGWIGFTDKYWLTALAPGGTPQMAASFRRTPSGGYQADYAEQPHTVAPGQTVSTDTRLFAGAKEKTLLDQYEDAGIPKFSKAIDWGWFEWFMRPIFDLLNWLFEVTGNFGVAIICLTVIVRLIMFPIAQKQFKSMAAMRKLQPKMKALQERFKNDKAKQQQEIMKLYQQEKVNPAAGCLPVVLQVPVFYALYKVLLVSVEMRHQPFILWIKDLSAPDPATPVNLFGLLHFHPPGLLAIGILPIMVGFTQWLTFKLNPQQMDPTQQQIFSFMPWVMMFILAPFAAGLMLYWMTSNLLTFLQQWWLYRRFGLHLSDTHPVHT